MSVKIKISPILCQYTDKQQVAEVNGSTVGQCLENLVKQFPKLKLFNKEGKLLPLFGLHINGQLAYPQKLNKPIKDGEEFSIILMIGGG